MQNKKKVIMLAIGVISLLTVVIGASYAYFSATVTGNGNDNGTSSITTAELPSLIYNNGENFNGENVYPGYKNIHNFTVKPQPNSKGTAVYVLHLNANVPVEFGSDIKVTVYKTTDKVNNNLSRTEGELSSVLGNDGKYQYSKVDTITLNGTLKKVYESILTTNSDLVIEEKQFDGSLQETTYYLVYEYLENNTNQDTTQGKIFSGKVTVSLQRELNPFKPLSNFGIQDTLTKEGNGLYEVNHNDAVIESPLSTLEKNNLRQTEYRYAGVNPNNYISFNNELWRMIGLVNTPEGSRIKLIRNESIGSYSWDTSDVSINNGYGVNEWSQADLMKLLNPGYESESVGGSLYFNRQSGNCYNNLNNATTACNFTTNGFTSNSKYKIETITWNIGSNGTNNYLLENAGLVSHFYDYERSNNIGRICTNGDYCNDTINRNSTWKGKIGLMSPTDYGYASSGGNTTSREACFNKEIFNWYEDKFRDCKINDWLYNSSVQWTMMPYAISTHSYDVFRLNNIGNIGSFSVYSNFDVRPSVFLILEQRITSGDGSQSNPYVLK